MFTLKRIFLYLFLALLAAVLVVAIWLVIPLNVDRNSPDPAVSYANANSDGGGQYQEAYFEHKGNQIHYVEAGKGDVILFLHGFPSFWYSHIRQMDAFKSDYRVVAIDGLGAGRSDTPGKVENYSLDSMTEHLLALVDHIGADKVHIVGHDWGSGLGFAFSQRYPERVHTVTGTATGPQSAMLELLNTKEYRETGAYIEKFKQANIFLLLMLRVGNRIYSGAYQPLVAAGKLSAGEGELFRNATASPKRINAHLNWYRANIPSPDEITDDDYYPSRGARVTVPALFVWGNKDRLVTADGIEKIRTASDNLETLEVDGAGHWPHVREHEMVTAKIRSHIEGRNSTLGN